MSKALSSDKKLAKEVAREAQAADKAEETIDDDAADKTAGPADSTAPAQPSESDKDADGKLIVWDVSGDEAKEVEVLQGIIPNVSDSE